MENTTQSVDLIEKAEKSNPVFGFWLYLMTDCVLFASLFAVYAVLHNNTFGGPSGKDIFSLPYVLTETILLLTSSFTSGLSILAARRSDKTKLIFWTIVTFILGAGFLIMEIKEFHHLAVIGDSWRRSGFLSSYFTLVGTHGLHIATGLIWMIVLLVQISFKGLRDSTAKHLTMLNMFWHFLDVIWIFIFTIVYLMGNIGI